MEAELLLGGLILLAVLIGSILGIISFFRIIPLKEQLYRFEQKVFELSEQVQSLYDENLKLRRTLDDVRETPQKSSETEQPIAEDKLTTITNPNSPSVDDSTPADTSNTNLKVQDSLEINDEELTEPDTEKDLLLNEEPTLVTSTNIESSQQAPDFFDKVKENWMVWLGGLCIALAGIFLVKYSMDQGLLGPKARIAMGLITGLLLHGAAEWLRRTKGSHDSFAALAGGASITLFATFLAAFHLYELVPPGLVFVVLFIIAMVTMVLALIHGPVLAGIGILGAYIVPILVNTGSNNVMGAMIYSMIVTVSALFLIKYVYRKWLWLGTVVGALFWWLISLSSNDIQVQIFQPLYLAAIGYLVVAIHYSDWMLLAKWKTASGFKPWNGFKINWSQHENRLQVLFLLLIFCMSLMVAVDSAMEYLLVTYFPFAVVVMLVSRHKPIYSMFPWVLFITTCGAFFISLDANLDNSFFYEVIPSSDQNRFLVFLIFLAAFYFIFGLWNLKVSPFKGTASSLPLLSPFVLISVGYLMLPEFTQNWVWGLLSLLIGCCYMAFVIKYRNNNLNKMIELVLILGAHIGYSLTVVLLVEQATLTLALAAQVLSLAWLRQQFSVIHLDWAIKLLCTIVLVRLSLNPFILTYDNDVHWSLWTYGGSLVFCFAAARILPSTENTRIWLEGACLHLLVLLIATETRYWMYDGNIFVSEYGFTEATLNTLVWGVLSLVYYWRSQLSNGFVSLYQWASKIMLGLTAGNFVFIQLFAKNPLWSEQTVSSWPVLNILLLSYGAPILLLFAYARYFELKFRNHFLFSVAALSFFFINLEIRHLWTPEIHINYPMSNGELYTYSLVWLVLAIGGVLVGTRYAMEHLYKSGMVLLLAVIAKIFLVDMSGLEGLLRVMSFMGLGLSLLGLAFMHQKIKKAV